MLMVVTSLSGAFPALAGTTARFDYVEYQALEDELPVPAGSYRNPILPGFHPDPSITRVGDDFYLVTSTFSWFPGLPIFHSRDLVNWQLAGHAIDRPGQVDFSGLGTNRGLFAPAITHHDGRFFILNTCIDCRGNFMITADDPSGPWSDPVWLPFDGIDPSLFFGEDGRSWIVYNDAPPGQPQYDGHRALWLQQFNPQTSAFVGERILLVDGGVDLAAQPVWAEGPHIYRVGEYYYLLAAEGGTADQHSQTIYRSRSVTGPYEPGPVNPILTQRDLPADRPDRVEATGHADLVQLDDGSWWGVFLATRPFAGQSTLLGRETYLLPVSWEDGWPLFLPPGAAVPPVNAAPDLPPSPGTDWQHWRDDFDQDRLSAEWIGIRTPGPVQQIGQDHAESSLWVITGKDAAGSLAHPAFTGRRLRHHAAQVTTKLDFNPAADGEFAGLLAFMDEAHFLAFGIEQVAGERGERQMVARLRTDAAQDQRGEVVARAPMGRAGAVELRLQLNGGEAQLSWRMAGDEGWNRLGNGPGNGPGNGLGNGLNVEPLASIHAGLFTGLVIGPYSHSGEIR
ncbi:family 43 glycosylhydrolase [Altererythrobacter aestuarii]|uniref:Family 43 glycosylhydrolase n=1 Tax=Alteraurantiacibacter aestuarii TaxID=650004 RepID=A0A844ZRH1_9SPHN|nr:family 43 glycosylhydrolase [Alteraurantiacibacter aestuarii]